MDREDIAIAARASYEAVRAYRRQIGMADMLPWIDAGNAKQIAFEQAVIELSKGKQRPKVNIEEVLIEAVATAVINWRGARNDNSTTASR